MYLPMFSWHVFKANLLDMGVVSHEQLDAMKKECYTMRKEDPIGRNRSNNGAGWQSVDGVNNRPMFQSLLNGVEEVFNKEVFPFHCGEHHENFILDHGNYWVNINKFKDAHSLHNHPGCVLSGVFYVKVPEKAGPIAFAHPASSVIPLYFNKHIKHFTAYNSSFWKIDPRDNQLLMFPSWLEHSVEPNMNPIEERITIAFNLTSK